MAAIQSITTAQNVAKAKAFSPQLPWNVTDPRDLGPTVIQFLHDQEPFYRRWAQRWYENFQFLYGNQNLKWSRRNDYAVDYDFLLRRTPVINQKVQTNLVRIITESLASFIFGNTPDWDVESMTESSVKGKAFKRIVEKVLECYTTRLCLNVEWNIGSVMFALYGQCAWKVDWQANAGSILEIPRYNKVVRPTFVDWMAPNQMTGGLFESPVPYLGPNGMPQSEEVWEKALDQLGNQIVDRMMSGDVRVDTLSPFEYRRPMGSPGMHKDKYIEQILFLDYDEYLDRYESVGGKTSQWGQVKPLFSDQALYAFAAKLFLRMQMTTPPTFNDTFRRADNTFRNASFRQKVIVVEHYDRPHPVKWPMGRKLVITNGICTHVTVPNYHTNKLDGWHPYIEAQWMRVGPSSIASGPVNDVVQKNRELNVKDSLIATSVRRNMGSILLNKINNGVDKDQLVGDPGMVVDVADPFAMRWLHDDMPIPPIMSELRQMDKDDTYEVSGAGDSLRGERSVGASSGYQQRQLQEQEEKRLTPARENWELAISGCGEKLFTCLKTNVVQLSPDVMGFLMRSAAGGFTADDVMSLLGNQIDYGVDIRVKKSSMSFKSKASQQALLQEMAQHPAVAQRLQNDAKVVDEYLKFFDADQFRDRSASQRDRAQKENEHFIDLLRKQGKNEPKVLYEDDDNIHMAEHAEFLLQNADEIMQDQQFFMQFLLHQETHRIQDQEKQAKLMPGATLAAPQMQAMAMQQLPPSAAGIYLDAQMRAQQAAMQMKQGTAPQGNPQAPKNPKQEVGGPGNKQTDPNAPSDNTKPGEKGGMDQ